MEAQSWWAGFAFHGWLARAGFRSLALAGGVEGVEKLEDGTLVGGREVLHLLAPFEARDTLADGRPFRIWALVDRLLPAAHAVEALDTLRLVGGAL